jgi:hypothetical protein
MIRTVSKEGTQAAERDRIFSQELVMAFLDHIPLMVIGPPVIAVLAYLVLVGLAPGAYTSTSILRLDRATARVMQGVMTSPIIADRVLSRYSGAPANIEGRARYVAKNLSIVESDPGERQGDRIYRMEFKYPDARAAQSISSDLIDAWLTTTVPGPNEQKNLQAELERLKLSVATNSKLIEQLRGEATTLLSPNSMPGELATPISALIAKRDQSLATMVGVESRLAGLSRDVIVLPPDLPQTAEVSGKRGLTILAGFAGAVLLFTLVLLGRYYAPGRSPRDVMSGWFRRVR